MEILLNTVKSSRAAAGWRATAETVRLALEHGLPIHSGNHKYAGGYVGVDDLDGSRFVTAKLATQVLSCA